MHLNSPELAECVYTNRWRTRHAGEKLWLAGGLLVLSIALPPYPVALVIAALMTLLTLGGARVRLGLYLRVLAVPLGFAMLSAASLLVSVSVNADGIKFGWATGGVTAALQTLARSGAALTCLSFLIVTTPFNELLGLLRRAGLPAALCELMLVMQRFVSLLAETAQTMWQAQAARCGWATWKQARRSFSLITVQLFIRSIQRARAAEIGLQARGYNGELLMLETPHHTSRWALGGIALLHAGILGLSLFEMNWYAR